MQQTCNDSLLHFRTQVGRNTNAEITNSIIADLVVIRLAIITIFELRIIGPCSSVQCYYLAIAKLAVIVTEFA